MLFSSDLLARLVALLPDSLQGLDLPVLEASLKVALEMPAPRCTLDEADASHAHPSLARSIVPTLTTSLCVETFRGAKSNLSDLEAQINHSVAHLNQNYPQLGSTASLAAAPIQVAAGIIDKVILPLTILARAGLFASTGVWTGTTASLIVSIANPGPTCTHECCVEAWSKSNLVWTALKRFGVDDKVVLAIDSSLFSVDAVVARAVSILCSAHAALAALRLLDPSKPASTKQKKLSRAEAGRAIRVTDKASTRTAAPSATHSRSLRRKASFRVALSTATSPFEADLVPVAIARSTSLAHDRLVAVSRSSRSD
ncbi:hypothetical protein JCM10212_000888 [Sporobolomyces blumeae]